LTVLDASAAVCILLNTPAPRASALRRRLAGEDVQAPHLIDLEVTQTLRRLVFGGSLPLDRAHDALSDLEQFPLIRYPHYPLLGRIWQLRANVTPYDASYVALAELLAVPLLTLDARLGRAGTGAIIEIF
jgi:predicted nucleic acid-binding protein